MPLYAQCKDGRVIGFIETEIEFIPIDAPLPSGRFLYDGKITPCPDVTISADGEHRAGAPIVLQAVAPGGWTLPESFEILVNDHVAQWLPENPVVFYEAGVYTFRVTGPWPWESNKIYITVTGKAEPDVNSFKP